MIEGTLRAYYFQLRLSVEDYEFPHLNTGRDGNALACHVVIEDTEIGDSYPLRHSPTLYNFELASFTERLRALERAGSGHAVLGNPDAESGDEFGLTISLSDGTGTLAGFVGNKAGARLGLGRSTSTPRSSPMRSRSSTTSSTPSPFAATSPPTEHHQGGPQFSAGAQPHRGNYATERPA